MPDMRTIPRDVGAPMAEDIGSVAKKTGRAVGTGAKRAAKTGSAAASQGGAAAGRAAVSAAKGTKTAVTLSGNVAGKAVSLAATGTKKAVSAVAENPMLAVAGAGVVGAAVGEMRKRSRTRRSSGSERATATAKSPATTAASSTRGRSRAKTSTPSSTRKSATRKTSRARFDVSPDKRQGGWVVKGKGRSEHFEMKQDAIDRAAGMARSTRDAQVVIRKKDGTIQSERTYGNDPRRSKG